MVKAKSGKSCVVVDGDVCRVSVKAAAEKGAANLEVVKLLSKHFKKPVRIISGFKSKKKLVQIMQ
ncbi:MAG: DUF167 domain-containing protein [Nanoarchaeota archaeon]|nr:DUF167 domain-containing protein [Nanoarchaeota archaeon]